MKKDFDFDDIGKRTPYRTPDGFFEDVQQKVMERAGVKQQRKSHMKLIISTVITMAAVLIGFLFVIRILCRQSHLASHQEDGHNYINKFSLHNLHV